MTGGLFFTSHVGGGDDNDGDDDDEEKEGEGEETISKLSGIKLRNVNGSASSTN